MFEDFFDLLRGLVQLVLVFSLFADRRRDVLAQLQILRAQALCQLHELCQLLFEGVKFALHGRTIDFKSLLSQSITGCFASELELSEQFGMVPDGGRSATILPASRCSEVKASQLNGKQVRNIPIPVLPPQR